ncbi:MAG: SusC/RagA family TonB-linked outer membrane protein, partial [Bacteroidales bacterium]|nr:SusC/RagA family TonB-linked outer membrane protein [Bacteroidales bacterium]
MLSKKLFGLLAGLLCLAATFSASAQNLTVRGTVSDAAGPVVGAVVLSGGANAVTDMDGAYTIAVPSNAVLEVSCLGYVTQQVPVNGRTTINVILEEDVEVLQEAVALGYGAQTKKKDLSASVGIVNNADKIVERPVTTPTLMLQGQVPGVVIANDGGKPTSGQSMVIRGQGSRNGDSVLWVVDGVPGAPIISMNDIESIVVLKDAASAAIYGATSGAGGVILVTTKKANKGIHVEYDVIAGVRSAYNLPEPLTAEEEIRMKTISHQNAGIGLPSGWDPAVNPWVGVQRTNFMDECFRVAPYQRHAVTLNYGTDVFKSRLTFNYQDNQGIMVGTYKKNLGVRFQGEYQMNKWLQFTETMSYDDGFGRGVDDNSAHTGVILSALWMPPSAEAYATAGPYAGIFGGTTTEDPEYVAKYGSNFADIHGDTVNPLRLLLANDEWGHSVDFWSTSGIHITPIRGLKLSSLFTLNVHNGNSKTFSPGRPEIGKRETGNRLSVSASRDFQWRSENTITYDRTFDKHTVGALGAFTINNQEQQGFGGYGVGLADESPKMQFMKFASSKDINSDYYNMDRNIAFVGRVSYSYDDRYFMTASYRRDYAGRLPDAHNYGDFPAVTGAWKVSSEPFFPKNDYISLLKFRASWGRVGNLGSVGWHYKSNSLNSSNWNEAPNYGIGAGQIFGTFWYPATAINNELTWETSETVDGGVDIDMFKDRLSISVDLYNKRTFNLIQDQTMGWPATIGRNAMKVNQGEIANRGIELIATWRDNLSKDFSYYVTGNFAYNHNEVISTGILDDEGNPGKWTGGGDWGGV